MTYEFPMYVFVYGTLKRGGWNNRILKEAGAQYVKDYVLNDFKIYRNPPDFPLGNWVEGSSTLGELWEIYDQGTLDRLDSLEGHPHFYTRSVGDAYNGKPIHTYVYNRDCEKQGVEPCIQLPLGEYYWNEKKVRR